MNCSEISLIRSKSPVHFCLHAASPAYVAFRALRFVLSGLHDVPFKLTYSRDDSKLIDIDIDDEISKLLDIEENCWALQIIVEHQTELLSAESEC